MKVGPGASRSMQWADPLTKLQQRVTDLAQAKLAPSLSAQLFYIRASAVLGYVAQPIPATAEVERSFGTAVARLWHVPHKSLPDGALRPVRTAGAPMPKHFGDGLQATLRASQVRLAPIAVEAAALLARARARVLRPPRCARGRQAHARGHLGLQFLLRGVADAAGGEGCRGRRRPDPRGEARPEGCHDGLATGPPSAGGAMPRVRRRSAAPEAPPLASCPRHVV